MNSSEQVRRIYTILDAHYPGELGFLRYRSPFELLIAVILSAQTTDRQVNAVTPELFRQFPTPAMLAAAEADEVADIIRSTGYFRVKSRNSIQAARVIHEEFADAVPDEMELLLKIPGVGRKSANVILGAVFDKPAIIVDTHFARVVRRLGLTRAGSPAVIEREVSELVAPGRQYRFSMLINNHGRVSCQARSPDRRSCPLRQLCPRVGIS